MCIPDTRPGVTAGSLRQKHTHNPQRRLGGAEHHQYNKNSTNRGVQNKTKTNCLLARRLYNTLFISPAIFLLMRHQAYPATPTYSHDSRCLLFLPFHTRLATLDTGSSSSLRCCCFLIPLAFIAAGLPLKQAHKPSKQPADFLSPHVPPSARAEDSPNLNLVVCVRAAVPAPFPTAFC